VLRFTLVAVVFGLACVTSAGRKTKQCAAGRPDAAAQSNLQSSKGLTIDWHKNVLTIHSARIPGNKMIVNYLEAFCRPGSTDQDWGKTVIKDKTVLVSAGEDGKHICLKSTLADGVVVQHDIRATDDTVEFHLVARNPTEHRSFAAWAQPCIRVDRFTGVQAKSASEAYLPKSFIFVNGNLTRMPVQPWAKKARYTPGQVWCPKGVDRDDVNPRPLSSVVPSNGLIGCFSVDEKMIMATAWEPYQELFQGVLVCLHSDFRIGGLKPGETKHIRGTIYLVDADADAIVKRYRKDFPEQQTLSH